MRGWSGYRLRQEFSDASDVEMRGLLPFRLSPLENGEVILQLWKKDIGGTPGAVYAEISGELGTVIKLGWKVWRMKSR